MQQSFFNDMRVAGGSCIRARPACSIRRLTRRCRRIRLQSTNGNLVSSGPFAVDTTLSRLYAMTDDQPLGLTAGDITIEGFNLTTRLPTWIARFASPQSGSSLIRWGTNGLAFATGGTAPTIALISGSIVSR